MKNKGLFSTLFIEDIREEVELDDNGHGRMATLAQKWQTRDESSTEEMWDSFLKQAISYLQFVPPPKPAAPNVYPLFEDYSFTRPVAVLYFVPPQAEMDDVTVGQFWPGKLVAELKKRNLNWGVLTDGAKWRLYSLKTAKPYEDFVELDLVSAISDSDEKEYALFERFFHRDSFVKEERAKDKDEKSEPGETEGNADDENGETEKNKDSASLYKCRLDTDAERSEEVLEELVKAPLLSQVDEILQYVCNGFIADTMRKGAEYAEEERREIFESAVKLLYRALFLFYAEARSLLPSEPDKAEEFRKHSIRYLCEESRKFRWNQRRDTDGYDLWKHLKGLVNAVNDGDAEYGIMGYNGGLFDDQQEKFLGKHRLRNDFLARAMYLLAYVEPWDNDPDKEYAIPYEDLEVRHLGELYENILEFNVTLADADRIRRRTKKGVEMLLVSQTTKKAGDTLIKKGDVYFGESALERKQTGSYYTPESLVRFLNQKTIVQPLGETFERKYRQRFYDLLEQAKSGHDTGTRRGAVQSAAALVERFAEEEIFHFKVCDPAMGSGHFLVDAANQMAGLVIALLAEVPYVEGMTVSVTSCPNDWRRRITRRCIYGVDLNPLAVNLAKLSLWLNCFATHHRLTFLDHHVRCGNSLIGIRSLDQLASIPERKKDSQKKKDQQRLLFDYNDLSSILAQTTKGVASITWIDEDDTDAQKAVLDEALETTFGLRPLADLYTSYLMDPDIPAGVYKEIFERLAKGKSAAGTLNPTLLETLESVEAYRDWHRFYHWPLEFPDVFGPDAAVGFSVTVGNPPWDIVKLNSQEFFSDYDPNFRSYDKQKANRESTKLVADNPIIAEKWEQYCEGFAEQNTYFKKSLSYNALGKGDINTFKLFLEQFLTMLSDGGRMGIVVPSGIYTDQGCQPLRELFFNQGRVDFFYCFENRWPTVFNAVDGRFKFVVFGTQKGGKTERFKCAFMEHDPERLPTIDADALKMSVKQVKKFSPDTLSVMEFKIQREIDIMTKIYGEWPLLGDYSNSKNWHIDFHREFHMSDDSDIFNTSCLGIPLFEGKRIWQFDSYLQDSNYYISEQIGRKRLLGSAKDNGQVLDYEKHRVVFRKIAANTNERTLVSSIIPPSSFTGENLTTSKTLFDPPKLLFITAILNSFCIDFVIRMRITTAINIYHLYQIPLPRLVEQNLIFDDVVTRCLRLICVEDGLSNLWASSMRSKFQSSTFWYPSIAPIDTYGPAHEQEIRGRLRDEAKNLTPEWGPHCGVHDRLPDRRDIGDRAQIRAEIDAYVAYLYGLSRDDFAYILDTFLVLKKKELQAFGEFRSKRKCLEEYDRLEKVLGRR
jgi:hypothetical protein